MRTLAIAAFGATLALPGCTLTTELGNGFTPLTWKGREQVVVPFTLDDGGRILVDGKVNGHPARIMLDTGASRAGISTHFTTATAGSETASMRVDGVTRSGWRDVEFEIGGLATRTSLVTSVNSPGFDALLGAGPLFSKAVIDIDFGRRLMTLIRDQDGFAPPPDAIEVDIVDRLSHVPAAEITIGDDQHICGLIDTGYNGALLVSDKTARDLGLARDPQHVSRARNSAGQTFTLTALAPLASVSFAGTTLENIRPTPRPHADGCRNNIGMEILSGYRLIFNLSYERMWVIPRAGIGSRFSTLGSITYRTLDEGMLVTRLDGNSAPQHAGVRVGDVIVAINGTPALSARLPPTGSPVEFTLSTGEKKADVMR